MPRKPTGQVGTVIVSGGETGPSMTWETIHFSQDKAAVECQIMEMFHAESGRQGRPPFTYRQNGVNDVDFTILLPDGATRYMEFTEADYEPRATENAGQATGRKNMYPAGEVAQFTYDFAQQILNRVRAKYGKPYPHPCDLLVYATHWQVMPSGYVLNLVRHFLQQEPPTPTFEQVVFLRPVKSGEAELHSLFPTAGDPLGGRRLDDYREHYQVLINPDPTSWPRVERNGRTMLLYSRPVRG